MTSRKVYRLSIRFIVFPIHYLTFTFFSLQWPVSKGQWDIIERNTAFCLHVNYSMEFTPGVPSTTNYQIRISTLSCIIILVNSPSFPCPLDNKTGDVDNANKWPIKPNFSDWPTSTLCLFDTKELPLWSFKLQKVVQLNSPKVVNSLSVARNALARVQRLHETADLWDITFCTRWFWGF